MVLLDSELLYFKEITLYFRVINFRVNTYVSWSFEAPSGFCLANLVVIVKGSNDANVYFYPDGTLTSDAGLVSPDNASGGPADLSNLTFYWNLVPCETEVCYDDETAWATGPRYVTRGNWATYTEYEDGLGVILYAGQTYDAGTVNFSAVNEGVKITITLNPGFILNPDTDEAVKIQGYHSLPPSKNPSPGLFGTYRGTLLEITVPEFAFYAFISKY